MSNIDVLAQVADMTRKLLIEKVWAHIIDTRRIIKEANMMITFSHAYLDGDTCVIP